jgi:hypothetical protein
VYYPIKNKLIKFKVNIYRHIYLKS